MGTEKIPYDDINKKYDRAWTMRLLDRLVEPDVDGEELDSISGSLGMLDDPRSHEALVAIVEDRTKSDAVRQAAAESLRNASFADERVIKWWEDGDTILQYLAINTMQGIRFRPIVEAITSDPSHPLLQYAIRSVMYENYARPYDLDVKLQMLRHDNPKVRGAAAHSLIVDTPIIAEEALIQLSDDPDPDVVTEAIYTLGYYYTQRSYKRLFELRDAANEDIRDAAIAASNEIRREFLHHLSYDEDGQKHPFQAHILNWLTPIWEQLAFTQEELEAGMEPWQPSNNTTIESFDEAVTALKNLDLGCFSVLKILSQLELLTQTPAQRSEMTTLLLEHLDPQVRWYASELFHVWEDQDSLLQLVADIDPEVRQMAIGMLRSTPPFKPEIANLLWTILEETQDGNLTLYWAALDAYAAHENPQVAIPRLFDIAQNKQMVEDQRRAAIYGLYRIGAKRELSDLMAILSEPPMLTWELHSQLLMFAKNLGIKIPSIKHLIDVDDLRLQIAIAPFIDQESTP